MTDIKLIHNFVKISAMPLDSSIASQNKLADYYMSGKELEYFSSLFTSIFEAAVEENKQFIHNKNSVADITEFVFRSYENKVLDLLDDETPRSYSTSYDRCMNKTVTVNTNGMYKYNVMTGALPDEFVKSFIKTVISSILSNN